MHEFSTQDRRAVYRAINERRDIRHFIDHLVDDAVLARILRAAHAAPSVGFMQPWDFIIVRDKAVRERIRAHVLSEKKKAGTHYKDKRAELYQRLKLEGIMECSLLIAVTCDKGRGGPINLGRATMPQTAQFSVCAAIQNLWLAARAEGLGVGWVSILRPDWIKKELGVPRKIEWIALLCLGAAESFPDQPLLQTVGWRQREPFKKLVHGERWGKLYPWES